MLANLRAHSGGIIAKLLLGLLVLVFGVWGIGDIFMSRSGGPLVTIGKERISVTDFQRIVRQEQESLRARMGGTLPPEFQKPGLLEKLVLEKTVQQSLMAQEAERLGIAAGKDALIAQMRRDPAFKDVTGKYDAARFRQVLQARGLSEAEYARLLERDLTVMALYEPLHALGAEALPDPVVDAVLAAKEERRTATLIVLDSKAAPAPKEPDDAALEAYIKDHAASFTVVEKRSGSFVLLEAGPEQGKLTNTLEDALAGGATLAEAAKEVKRDVQSIALVKQNGKNDKGEMLKGPASDPVLLKALFETQSGTESDRVILKDGSMAVVRPEKVVPGTTRPLSEVRAQVVPGWKSEATSAALEKIAGDLATQLAEKKTTLESLKGKPGITILSSGPITRDGWKKTEGSPLGEALPPSLIGELFSKSPQAFTASYGLGNGFTPERFVIARLDGIQPYAEANVSAAERKKAHEALKQQLKDTYGEEILSLYFRDLEARHGVSINEALFKSLVKSAE